MGRRLDNRHPGDLRVDAAADRRAVAELLDRWRTHRDARAREELIARHLPIADALARRYRGAPEPLEDLRQVACLGLLKAIERFDTGRGTDFTAFAVPTILGELRRYFRDCCWPLHVPRGLQELVLAVERARRELAAPAGRQPTAQEIADRLGADFEMVLEALEAAGARRTISWETHLDAAETDQRRLGDTVGAVDRGFELVEIDAWIGSAAGRLTDAERMVLALRFVADRTQSEIATELGVSQMQVSRILRRALSSLGAGDAQ